MFSGVRRPGTILCLSSGNDLPSKQVPTAIVVDTRHIGLHFTDPTKGKYITFDIDANGKPLKMPWPEHGSGNAWLVLDRNGDGRVKDGTAMFGNFTPHSDGGVANRRYTDLTGFLALAWYDKPEQGGNLDLVIDKDDAIWSKLRLWIDDHCYLAPDKPCESLPRELHTLESVGIHSLSLVYQISATTDDSGNAFKFQAVVNPDISDIPKNEYGFRQDSKGYTCCDLHQQSKDGRLMYDVGLKTLK